MYASARMRLFFPAMLVLLAGLAGCGSGNSLNGQGPGLGDNSNNSLLQGQYAFAVSGQNSGGLFFAVGSFTADGQGHLGGIQDVNGSSLSTSAGARFSGTYAVGADGRGNAVLGLQAGCPNWQFTMITHAHALLTCLNTNMTGSGSIDLQDTTAFSTAALKGNYVFGFSGLGLGGASLAVSAGNWSMDGAGHLGGQTDINDLGATQLFPAIPLSGTYSVSSNGRGTATFSSSYSANPQNFVFYVVNATDLKFMEVDSTPAVSGEVLSQAPSVNTASFNGTYAFTLGGSDFNGNPLAFGGLLPADGNGNTTAGLLDINYGGSSSVGGALTGTYNVSASGRGLATLSSAVISPFPVAFYKAANGVVELVNMGGTISGISFAASGMAKAQSGAPFGAQSINGNYAVNFSGTNLGGGLTSGAVEEDISGQLTGDGAGALSGVLDINNGGSIFQGVPLTAGNYAVSSDGRGNAAINTGTGTFAMQTYQIDPNTVLFLDVDTNRVMTGIGNKQQF